MSDLVIEKATTAADLPHKFEANELGWCKVCRGHVIEPKHLAWETAQHVDTEPTMPRERGV